MDRVLEHCGKVRVGLKTITYHRVNSLNIQLLNGFLGNDSNSPQRRGMYKRGLKEVSKKDTLPLIGAVTRCWVCIVLFFKKDTCGGTLNVLQ
jgi:hypothetical protein